MPRKKNTCMYLVAALLFLGGLGYLVFSGLSENTVYFLNVSEARAATADKLQAARLFGTVAPDNLLKNVDGPGASFLLQDKDDAGPVSYTHLRGRRPREIPGQQQGQEERTSGLRTTARHRRPAAPAQGRGSRIRISADA